MHIVDIQLGSDQLELAGAASSSVIRVSVSVFHSYITHSWRQGGVLTFHAAQLKVNSEELASSRK